jgi:hypothetical protein
MQVGLATSFHRLSILRTLISPTLLLLIHCAAYVSIVITACLDVCCWPCLENLHAQVGVHWASLVLD